MARVDGRAVRAKEVDARLALKLYDLALAGYRLRASSLDTVIARRLRLNNDVPADLAHERVEILWAPPEAPRIEIPLMGSRIRGPEDARVTLTEFVDFQAGPSRSLQPVLERVLEEYPDTVRLAVRDLALPFHRYAQKSAEAARCAGDQNAYWPYHEMLLMEQPGLESEDLRRYALRLDLEPAVFDRCLNEDKQAALVRADGSLAALLGISRAPSLFVNGRYLPPPFTYEGLVRAIEAETGDLRNSPVAAERKNGALEPSEQAGPKQRPGGNGLHDPQFDPESTEYREPADAVGSGEHLLPPLPEVPLDRLVEPEAVLDLARDAVDQALEERPRLEANLQTSPGVFSGRRLLKLTEIQPGDLYDRLGLRNNDVLMLVDDQWITDEANPLWDALQNQSEITLLVMRRGRPHRYRYRFR
ncbi:MAG TPA: hypothetical protein EYG06_00355 [Myxococcales bacterium]|nr:hypothetical protein [Myxococcales bacterium]